MSARVIVLEYGRGSRTARPVLRYLNAVWHISDRAVVYTQSAWSRLCGATSSTSDRRIPILRRYYRQYPYPIRNSNIVALFSQSM